MRGIYPEDKTLFTGEELLKLKKAAKTLYYLLEENYNKKPSINFICNRFLFPERQRVVLSRAILKPEELSVIREREVKDFSTIKEVSIDGFNAIILFESIMCKAPVLKCNDGVFRDMANLRGKYKILDETSISIKLILGWLDSKNIEKATIYLDEPVSNSRNLKRLILEISKDYKVDLTVDLRFDVDKTLYEQENVISGDFVVLMNSKSWTNMYADIIKDINDLWIIDFLL